MGRPLEGGVGVGRLRDLSAGALDTLARVTETAVGELLDQRPQTSFAQNADGSLFFTATVVDAPVKIRWAFITRDGDRHPFTGYEEESAVREACRLGPWGVEQLLDDLAAQDDEQLDIAEVRISSQRSEEESEATRWSNEQEDLELRRGGEG